MREYLSKNCLIPIHITCLVIPRSRILTAHNLKCRKRRTESVVGSTNSIKRFRIITAFSTTVIDTPVNLELMTPSSHRGTQQWPKEPRHHLPKFPGKANMEQSLLEKSMALITRMSWRWAKEIPVASRPSVKTYTNKTVGRMKARRRPLIHTLGGALIKPELSTATIKHLYWW